MIRYLTAGESHGKALVGIIEGLPAGIDISAEEINLQLARRKKGYGRGGRMKIETDTVEIISGIRFGKTIGSPVALLIENIDYARWKKIMDHSQTADDIDPVEIPRPGHADFVGSAKYKFTDLRNVIERASARETAMRVALGAVVRKFLEIFGITIGSHVVSIGTAKPANGKKENKKIQTILASGDAVGLSKLADKSSVRMIDAILESKSIGAIRQAKKTGDTLGGIFEVYITGVPAGLGSYVHYDRKLDAQLVHALVSIQAVKGAELGHSFRNAGWHGSAVHDELFVSENGTPFRMTNRAGGIEGGMSNGEIIVLRGAMKPIATLAKPLRSFNIRTNNAVQSRYERSDVCAVPACSVIAEAVVAPVIANAFIEKFGGDSVTEIIARIQNESLR